MQFLILMATCNGIRFLDTQLQSLANQDVDSIDIIVSDDGSNDGTLECLYQWREKWPKGRFEIIFGPQNGFNANFRHLITTAPNTADFVAFCDQDDVWKPKKLSTGVQQLAHLQSDQCGLYCGRTRLISDSGIFLGYSRKMNSETSFKNALVQSIAGANTMILNRAAFKIVKSASKKSSFVSHDWWSYLLVSGAGGDVIYDPTPMVDYRQHKNNLVGANRGLISGFYRLFLGAKGRMKQWLDINLTALQTEKNVLTQTNAELLGGFVSARQRGSIQTLVFLIENGIKRQSNIFDLKLYAAALCGRL